MAGYPKSSPNFSGLDVETALKREDLWSSRELAARSERALRAGWRRSRH